jgi:oxaloacetate decarboxylase alpha subunit
MPATAAGSASPTEYGPEAYQVTVDGRAYNVVVAPGGAVTEIQAAAQAPAAAPAGQARPATAGVNIPAPLAGNIFKINVAKGQSVNSGDVIMILEAMKMETEVRSPESGTVRAVVVKEGDAVQVGDILLTLG